MLVSDITLVWLRMLEVPKNQGIPIIYLKYYNDGSNIKMAHRNRFI